MRWTFHLDRAVLNGTANWLYQNSQMNVQAVGRRLFSAKKTPGSYVICVILLKMQSSVYE